MRVNMFCAGKMESAERVIQASSSRKSDRRLFLARPSLERYTVADRRRQSRVIHLSLELSNDLARNLNPVLLIHREILS